MLISTLLQIDDCYNRYLSQDFMLISYSLYQYTMPSVQYCGRWIWQGCVCYKWAFLPSQKPHCRHMSGGTLTATELPLPAPLWKSRCTRLQFHHSYTIVVKSLRTIRYASLLPRLPPGCAPDLWWRKLETVSVRYSVNGLGWERLVDQMNCAAHLEKPGAGGGRRWWEGQLWVCVWGWCVKIKLFWRPVMVT